MGQYFECPKCHKEIHLEPVCPECDTEEILRARVAELEADWAVAEKRLTQIAFLDPERASCRDAIEIAIRGCD